MMQRETFLYSGKFPQVSRSSHHHPTLNLVIWLCLSSDKLYLMFTQVLFFWHFLFPVQIPIPAGCITHISCNKVVKKWNFVRFLFDWTYGLVHGTSCIHPRQVVRYSGSVCRCTEWPEFSDWWHLERYMDGKGLEGYGPSAGSWDGTSWWHGQVGLFPWNMTLWQLENWVTWNFRLWRYRPNILLKFHMSRWAGQVLRKIAPIMFYHNDNMWL